MIFRYCFDSTAACTQRWHRPPTPVGCFHSSASKCFVTTERLWTREMESLTHSDGLEGKHFTQSMQQLSKEEKWGYAQEDIAFVDSIVAGAPAAVTALDGFKSVELVDACYRSIQSGERVRINADR
jgi:predicted dehydrogenase